MLSNAIRKTVAVSAVALSVLAPATAFAMSGSGNKVGAQVGTETGAGTGTQNQVGAQGTAENRCSRVTERVNTRLNQYNEKKVMYANRFQNIRDAVGNMATRLENRGYDVTEVEANLETMDGMIDEFSGTYERFMNRLGESKQYACGNSEGQFRNTIQNSLGELKQARVQAGEIKGFVEDTLRPSMLRLQQQKGITDDVVTVE